MSDFPLFVTKKDEQIEKLRQTIDRLMFNNSAAHRENNTLRQRIKVLEAELHKNTSVSLKDEEE